jgi:hypothetical protein
LLCLDGQMAPLYCVSVEFGYDYHRSRPHGGAVDGGGS